MSLADQHCVTCRGGVPKLTAAEIAPLTAQLPKWAVIDHHHIVRTFPFPDFKIGLDFVNHIGEIAEEQAHHPDILLAWGRVTVTIWTHKVDGLTESDFVLAAKIDRALHTAPRFL